MRPLAAFSEDLLAHLHLGAALVRGGDELRGVFELQKGLQALRDWIEDIRRARPFEDFWDPNGQIRGEIQRVLDLIARKRFDRERLLASVEWIACVGMKPPILATQHVSVITGPLPISFDHVTLRL